MQLLIRLTLPPGALVGAVHHVMLDIGGVTQEVFLGNGFIHPLTGTTQNDLNQTVFFPATPFAPGLLAVRAGSSGCPGPISIQAFAYFHNKDNAVIFVAQTVFSGSGNLAVDVGTTGVLLFDRGFDYYATLSWAIDTTTSHDDFVVSGLTNKNYLSTSQNMQVFPSSVQNRFVLQDWITRGSLTMGLNTADLPNLSTMYIGLVGSVIAGGDNAVTLSVSRGLRAVGVVLVPAQPITLASFNGRPAIKLTPDWSQLPIALPDPTGTETQRHNILTKRIDTTFIPGSPGVIGSPGRPATPATTTFVQEQVCTWGPDPAAMARQGWTLGPMDNNPASPTFGTRLWLPPGVGQATGFGTGWGGRGGAAGVSIRTEIPYVTTCRFVNRLVHIPAQPAIPPVLAVPAIPSQTIREFNTGWTGRVRSTRSFVGEGRAQFRAPRNLIGAVVGLSSSFHPSGVGGVHYAFRLENGTARAIDQAGVVTNLGVYNDDDLFEIRRFGGQITYRINDVVMHSVSNTGAPLYLNAVLFSGGDSIHNPVIGGFTQSNVSLMPLTSSASGMQFFLAAPPAGSTTPGALQPLHSWGWGSTQRGAISTVSLRPLEVRSRPNVRSHTALRALTALGSNRTYGAAVASLLPIAVAGEGGLGVPTYAISATMIGFLASSGRILSGGVLTGGGSLRPLFGLASDRVYGAGAFALAPLTSWGVVKSAAEMLDASVISPLLASGGADISGELAVVMTSTGHVSGLLNFLVVSNAEAVSEGTISMNYILNAVLSARAISAVTAASIGAPPQTFVRVGQGGTSETRPTASVWVVNARNSATSRYEDFQFNSFAKIGDRYYGAKDGGIYALDGRTDNGANIEAMVALGKHNFDTGSQLMRLENCYMGLASDGKMVLKVISEGREYIYRTRGSSTELQTQRVDIGRGIRANFMGFEVWNANGGDFDIQNIEFTAVVLNRRI